MTKNIFILLITLVFISCKSSKNTIISESKFYTDSIYSKSLSEYRKHNIYLPKGFDSKKNYPIVYKTDGNNINAGKFYKKTLDSLINNKVIQPIILVESYCNTKIADSTSTTLGDGRKIKLNFRNFEYVDNDATVEIKSLKNRFKNHMLFFKDEFITSIEKQLHQKKSKNHRYFYGVSNGAGFGMSLLNKHPELIGTYFCFSTFGGNIQTNSWKNDIVYPNLYIKYGTQEPFFLKDDADFIKKEYEESNSFAEIDSFEGGHDHKIWDSEFIKLLIKSFSINNK